ncbi:MAG: zinc ribbon domain-containing protein, partial [Clostridia bacterium]|nr:zinc ribbon domain-containing protein [Clostridia bacterium]
MFFIGVFGISDAQKHIGTYNNAICPSCGSLTRYEIFKSYSYLHIFFIPIFRWSVRYYVQSACCNRVFELDPSIGKQVLDGHQPEIKDDYLNPLRQHQTHFVCKNCNTCLLYTSDAADERS